MPADGGVIVAPFQLDQPDIAGNVQIHSIEPSADLVIKRQDDIGPFARVPLLEEFRIPRVPTTS